jgi:hypothetical protein
MKPGTKSSEVGGVRNNAGAVPRRAADAAMVQLLRVMVPTGSCLINY